MSNKRSEEVQAKLASLGEQYGFTTTSVARTEEENKQVGGVANSQHLDHIGTARDFRTRDKKPEQITEFVNALKDKGYHVITQTHGTGPHIHVQLPSSSRAASEERPSTPAVTMSAPDTSGAAVLGRPVWDYAEAATRSASEIRARASVPASVPRPTALAKGAQQYLTLLAAASGSEVPDDVDAQATVTAALASQKAGQSVPAQVAVMEAERQEHRNHAQRHRDWIDQYKHVWRDGGSATGELVEWSEADARFVDTTPDKDLRYLDHIDEWEEGRTAEEIERLREIGSGGFNRSMIEAELTRQDRLRESRDVMRGAGMARTLGLYTATGTAGDPLGMLAGFGVFKGMSAVGLGARQAFLAGRPVSGLALGGAEAAVGNLAVTGAIDALGQQTSLGDYAMALAFGGVTGVGFGGLELRGMRTEIAAAEYTRLANQIADQSAQRMQLFRTQARDVLGDNATEAEVSAKAAELDAEEARSKLDFQFAPLPDEARLSPRPSEDVVEDVPVQDNPIRMQPMEVAPGVRAYEYDDPTGATGTIMTEAVEGGEQINFSDLPASLQGQGIGRNMYRAVIDPVLDRGDSVFSDSDVSVAAARVYESLGRDYVVAKNPAAVLDGDQWRTADNSPVFKITGRKPSPTQVSFPPGSILRNRQESDAYAASIGLDQTITDPVERAMAAEMYARADRILKGVQIDEKRLRPLLSKAGMEAASTRMLLSKNPLMRAVAVQILENPEGAAGRHLTAAVVANSRHRVYRGTFEPEYHSLLNTWAKSKGYSTFAAWTNPEVTRRFNIEVRREADAQWEGRNYTDDPAVRKLVDTLNRGNTLMGADQQRVGTIGASRIEVGRPGYLTRAIRGDRVAALSLPARTKLQELFSIELQVTAGFDKEFSDQLAAKYFERAVDRALGSELVSLDLRGPDTADAIRDTLQALNFSEDEVQKMMGRFSRGGASHTKGRLHVDLNAEIALDDGSTMRLADVYDDDVLALYNQYARRVAGEVALAEYGIMGRGGVKLLRKAILSRPEAAPSLSSELDSFDQVFAEILGTPWKGRVDLGVAGDNIRSIVSSAYLGGMGVTQQMETSNFIGALGIGSVLRYYGNFPRLLREVRAAARGDKTSGLLSTLEDFNGLAGSDPYVITGLRDIGDRHQQFGEHALGKFSLAVRGAGFVTRVISAQRASEATQIRWVNEEILRKAFRFAKEGSNDKALADMGFTPELLEALRRNIPRATKWEGGVVTQLNLYEFDDPMAARVLAAVTERGAAQIVQRTFVGETGTWIHKDHVRILTQFRDYPLIAMQKQWRRQAFTHGTWRAAGLVLGAASVVLPWYMARLAVQGIGKDDDWWEQRLSLMELGRATMRYISVLGMTADVVDALAPIAGLESGGRHGLGAQMVPAASYANDVARALVSKDPDSVWKLLPSNRNPALQALFQSMAAAMAEDEPMHVGSAEFEPERSSL